VCELYTEHTNQYCRIARRTMIIREIRHLYDLFTSDDQFFVPYVDHIYLVKI
jgi:hypothetical protein